jgi:hypothetical protein
MKAVRREYPTEYGVAMSSALRWQLNIGVLKYLVLLKY